MPKEKAIAVEAQLKQIARPSHIRKAQCDSFDEACALVNNILGAQVILAKALLRANDALIEAKIDRKSLQTQIATANKRITTLAKGD